MKTLITLCSILILVFSSQLTNTELEPANSIDTDRAYFHAQTIARQPHLRLISFFDRYQCPRFNYELIDDYINYADQNNLDYRILPSISILESQCGKHYPKATNNLWGWNSARSGFSSFHEGIGFIIERLAYGKPYAGHTLERKLNFYCPNPTYPARIFHFMNQIQLKTN